MKRLLLALFLIATSAFATIGAGVTWELRQPGSDTNGGGFLTGASGSNMSLFNNKNATSCTSCFSATANLSTTDAVAVGTTTLTSATASFSSALIGNVIYISGGTGSITAQWRQVASVTNSTTVVLDTAIAASTGMTMNIGGALASQGQAAAEAVTGNIVYNNYNASAFSVTSASVNVSGGCLSSSQYVMFVGYNTNRTPTNTDTPQPTISMATGATAATFVIGGTFDFYNLILNGASQSGAKLTTGASFRNNVIEGWSVSSTFVSGNVFLGNLATGNAATALVGVAFYNEAYGNTATPISCQFVCYGNIVYNNTGAATEGMIINSTGPSLLANNSLYSNGQDGFSTSSVLAIFVNNDSESNTRNGYTLANGMKIFINDAAFGNATNVSGTPFANFNFQNLSGSGFSNPSGNVFTPGSTLQGIGYPSLFPRGLTASYPDIGAAQHQCTGGSCSATYPINLANAPYLYHDWQ